MIPYSRQDTFVLTMNSFCAPFNVPFNIPFDYVVRIKTVKKLSSKKSIA